MTSAKKIVIGNLEFDCRVAGTLSQITGEYKNDKTGKVRELFERDGHLLLQNEVFEESFDYVGENKFEHQGMTKGTYRTLEFNLKRKNAMKFILTTAWEAGKERLESFTKV